MLFKNPILPILTTTPHKPKALTAMIAAFKTLVGALHCERIHRTHLIERQQEHDAQVATTQ
jgi:hypothetical protein